MSVAIGTWVVALDFLILVYLAHILEWCRPTDLDGSFIHGTFEVIQTILGSLDPA